MCFFFITRSRTHHVQRRGEMPCKQLLLSPASKKTRLLCHDKRRIFINNLSNYHTRVPVLQMSSRIIMPESHLSANERDFQNRAYIKLLSSKRGGYPAPRPYTLPPPSPLAVLRSPSMSCNRWLRQERCEGSMGSQRRGVLRGELI